jgi:hypothetical protein
VLDQTYERQTHQLDPNLGSAPFLPHVAAIGNYVLVIVDWGSSHLSLLSGSHTSFIVSAHHHLLWGPFPPFPSSPSFPRKSFLRESAHTQTDNTQPHLYDVNPSAEDRHITSESYLYILVRCHCAG